MQRAGEIFRATTHDDPRENVSDDHLGNSPPVNEGYSDHVGPVVRSGGRSAADDHFLARMQVDANFFVRLTSSAFCGSFGRYKGSLPKSPCQW